MNAHAQPVFIFKILLVGSVNSNKTSFLVRYANGRTPVQIPTIGIDFKIKSILVDQRIVKLHVWDTLHCDRFRPSSRTPILFKGVSGIVLCYNIVDRKSFDILQSWIDNIGSSDPDIYGVVVGIYPEGFAEHERCVPSSEARDFAHYNNLQHFEIDPVASSQEECNAPIDLLGRLCVRRILSGGSCGFSEPNTFHKVSMGWTTGRHLHFGHEFKRFVIYVLVAHNRPRQVDEDDKAGSSFPDYVTTLPLELWFTIFSYCDKSTWVSNSDYNRSSSAYRTSTAWKSITGLGSRHSCANEGNNCVVS